MGKVGTRCKQGEGSRPSGRCKRFFPFRKGPTPSPEPAPLPWFLASGYPAPSQMNYLGSERDLSTRSRRATIVCDATLCLPFPFPWNKPDAGPPPAPHGCRGGVAWLSTPLLCVCAPETRYHGKAILRKRCKIPFFFPPPDCYWPKYCIFWLPVPSWDPAQRPAPAAGWMAAALASGWRPWKTSDGFRKASRFPVPLLLRAYSCRTSTLLRTQSSAALGDLRYVGGGLGW